MTSTPVFGDSRISTHADPTSSRRVIFHEWHISSVNFMLSLVYANVYIGVGVHCTLADLFDFGLLESKVPKMGDSVPKTPMNHHAKI